MIDFTQEVIENINIEKEEQELKIQTKYGILLVAIFLNDEREFSSPSHDSCDGLGDLISGDISCDIEAGIFTEDGDELEIDFSINEDKIYDFLND